MNIPFKSSGVTMTTNRIALSFLNISQDHLLMERIHLTAAIPLLAINTQNTSNKQHSLILIPLSHIVFLQLVIHYFLKNERGSSKCLGIFNDSPTTGTHYYVQMKLEMDSRNHEPDILLPIHYLWLDQTLLPVCLNNGKGLLDILLQENTK